MFAPALLAFAVSAPVLGSTAMEPYPNALQESPAQKLSAPGFGTKLRGKALIDDLSKRAVQYFWDETPADTGYTRDRAPNYDGARNNGDISSVAAIGYALSAYAIGAERGWINKEEARKRTILTLKNIPKIEGHMGWYYHFINIKTGKREWNCELSSIDSGLMFLGIVFAEAAWKDPEITKLSMDILSKPNWEWFMTDGMKKQNSLTISMGWSPTNGFLDARWDGYYEQMAFYIVGMGLDGLPANSWAAFKRGPRYVYKDIEILHGAALFIHQMSQAYIDFKGKRDYLGYDYWVSGRNMTLANRLYCIDNPQKFKGYGPDIWGLSACDIPGGYGAPGAPGAIWDNGVLAPAAAVASIMYTPDLSMRAADAFVTQFPGSYGRYGFTTGMSPHEDWRSPDVIGIDIGQMMLAIENWRDGYAWKVMNSSKIIQRGMAKAGLRKTSEGPVEGRKLHVPPVPIPPR